MGILGLNAASEPRVREGLLARSDSGKGELAPGPGHEQFLTRTG